MERVHLAKNFEVNLAWAESMIIHVLFGLLDCWVIQSTSLRMINEEVSTEWTLD